MRASITFCPTLGQKRDLGTGTGYHSFPGVQSNHPGPVWLDVRQPLRLSNSLGKESDVNQRGSIQCLHGGKESRFLAALIVLLAWAFFPAPSCGSESTNMPLKGEEWVLDSAEDTSKCVRALVLALESCNASVTDEMQSCESCARATVTPGRWAFPPRRHMSSGHLHGAHRQGPSPLSRPRSRLAVCPQRPSVAIGYPCLRSSEWGWFGYWRLWVWRRLWAFLPFISAHL